MQYSVKVTGAKELARVLGQDWARTTISPHVQELAQITFDFARVMVPLRSYKLHDSLELVPKKSLVFHVLEGAKHGGILRKGSPPHPIYPKVKRALAWPGISHPVASVPEHPGFRPNPYNERAAKYGRARIPMIGQKIKDDVARAIG